jgi:hypothetical protein
MPPQQRRQQKTTDATARSSIGNPKQYGSANARSLADQGIPPSAEQVADFHTNSDADTRKEAQHHTLGIQPYQASPGDHTHDGGTSPLLLAGVTITGTRGSPANAASIIAALVRLGATDSSTSA